MEIDETIKNENQIDDKKMNFMTTNKKIPKTKKNEKVKVDKKTKNITPVPLENKPNQALACTTRSSWPSQIELVE